MNASIQVIPIDSQQFIDLVSLEYHKEIAALLMTDPDRVIEKARANLKRWLLAYERGTREAWCFEEWEEILNRYTVPELIAIITEDSDNGQRLRSSTPFVGLLPSEEREEIRRRCEKLERFLNHLRAQRSAYDLAPLLNLINRLKSS